MKHLLYHLHKNSKSNTLSWNTSSITHKDQQHEGVMNDTSLEQTLDDMKTSGNFFGVFEDPAGDRSWNGTPPKKLGKPTVKLGNKKYDFNNTSPNAISNKDPNLANLTVDEVVFSFDIPKTFNYSEYRPIGRERKTKRLKINKEILPPRVAAIEVKIQNQSDDLQGTGMKIIIPSIIIDIWTRWEVLLGLKLNGNTDTLTEASNLIHELKNRGELQNEQQYLNALDNFITK